MRPAVVPVLMIVAAVLVAFTMGRISSSPDGGSDWLSDCASPCSVVLPAGSAEDDFLLDYIGQRATGTGHPVLIVTVRER